ncbi:hypothetical protein DLM45_08755 [Hyphomicrobium methylovorum]|uniref:helix-turn-helix domain-containing protein n=1 Tax=Hyphomicrobium methylovorum TaxID=84 RepID=UPI0015E749B4|nr:helix-turn-helix domain-containing protein [Hyphomicrobium methylovorum]MBA2126312.1 hypothetical protein [Hyphomicrobium methylovorum]
MLSTENLASTPTSDTATIHSKFATAIAKLATYIEYHSHQSGQRNVPGANDVAEIRRSDAEIAQHLDVSLVALEHAFADLVSQGVIKLRDAYKIEILDSGRLYALARNKA